MDNNISTLSIPRMLNSCHSNLKQTSTCSKFCALKTYGNRIWICGYMSVIFWLKYNMTIFSACFFPDLHGNGTKYQNSVGHKSSTSPLGESVEILKKVMEFFSQESAVRMEWVHSFVKTKGLTLRELTTPTADMGFLFGVVCTHHLS